MRIFFCIELAVTLSSSACVGCFFVGVIFTLFAILFTIVQPYKTPVYNIVDTVLVVTVALMYFCIAGETSHKVYSLQVCLSDDAFDPYFSFESNIYSYIHRFTSFCTTDLLCYYLHCTDIQWSPHEHTVITGLTT